MLGGDNSRFDFLEVVLKIREPIEVRVLTDEISVANS